MEYPFPIRKIIHVDMDAYFASVEQKDNPLLQGKPLAVGGAGDRGVIAAASYEARKYGVKSAMSGKIALQKCPHLQFVNPRFDRYKEVSEIIKTVFFEFTTLVEPLALDEAYLDVTDNKKGIQSATLLATEIRSRIYQKTGLTASAGISINKFLAKIASDFNKPNGQKTIPPEEVLAFMESLDIAKFYGVGKKTAEKMYNLGLFTGKDLKSKSIEYLEKTFGKNGLFYYQIVRGIQNSEVKPKRSPKSLGAERTFEDNISSEVFLISKIQNIAEELEKRLKKRKVAGKTITLKLKYGDFQLQTRSKTLPYFVSEKSLLVETAKELLYQEKIKKSVRLIGIAVSNLNTKKGSKTFSKDLLEAQLKFDF